MLFDSVFSCDLYAINIHLFLFTVLASPDDPMLVYKYVFLTLSHGVFHFTTLQMHLQMHVYIV